MHIRKGDTVQIIAGKDRGKTGVVLRIIPSRFSLVVEGLNKRKKHVRPRQQGKKGQVVEISAPLAISNVMAVCASCKKTTRIGHVIEQGSKRRFCKKCKATI